MSQYSVNINLFKLNHPIVKGICLDTPRQNEFFSHQQLEKGVLISGWVLSKKKVEIIVEPDHSGSYILNVDRVDVLEHFSMNESSGYEAKCGFSFVLNLTTDIVRISIKINQTILPFCLVNFNRNSNYVSR